MRAALAATTRDFENTVNLTADKIWDAGDMGCGDLVLELKFKISQMAAGQIIKVVALDPGAPEDMPAWCRMTGHTLEIAEHPNYWIRKKEK